MGRDGSSVRKERGHRHCVEWANLHEFTTEHHISIPTYEALDVVEFDSPQQSLCRRLAMSFLMVLVIALFIISSARASRRRRLRRGTFLKWLDRST